MATRRRGSRRMRRGKMSAKKMAKVTNKHMPKLAKALRAAVASAAQAQAQAQGQGQGQGQGQAGGRRRRRSRRSRR